jgi:hypothetical protein
MAPRVVRNAKCWHGSSEGIVPWGGAPSENTRITEGQKRGPAPAVTGTGLYKCCFENGPLALAAASFNGHSTQKQVVAA